jgi:predicted phosphoadenosine phosphosulfate sulfurtransferase
MPKTYSDQNVYDAAVERLDIVFREFEKVYVSFSGGKDSGVLLNLAIEAARRAGKLPLDVLLVDLEGQYKHTVDFAMRMLSKPEVRAHWVCLPLHLRNAVSQFQPHWLCWDPDKKDAWVRELPNHPGVINDEKYFPFFERGMEFEEFVPLFADWLSRGAKTCCLVGIRSDESLNRYRTVKNLEKQPYKGYMWTTRLTDGDLVNQQLYNAYPIYDWYVEDLWTANGKFDWDYNRIYDLMHLAGLTLHQMRLCQPYGDDQRKGLYLFKMLEPETWAKVVNRVEGANYGNRYSENDMHTMGNFKVILPPGHTYKSYAKFLLSTMPPATAEHFRKKIVVFFKWWKKHRNDNHELLREEGKLPDWRKGFPDYADPKLESGSIKCAGKQVRLPSWRRIVKVLLKNDYWCKGLSFSQTKREMEKQLAIIAKYEDL